MEQCLGLTTAKANKTKIFLVPSVASQMYSMLKVEIFCCYWSKKFVTGSTAVEFQAKQ